MDIVTGSVKTLEEFEVIKIEFAGRNETLEISGNGNVVYDCVTHGQTINIFQKTEDLQGSQDQSTAGYYNAQSSLSRYDTFERQQAYIDTLVKVQSIEHNVHAELTEAIEKLKELTYA